MVSVLTEKQCDSVQTLRRISKAVYIMRSDQISKRYRFGAVGVVGTNTAIRRLGQCARYDDGQQISWHYLVIAKLPSNTRLEDVRELEISLRKALIGKGGQFASRRTPRKDEFQWENARDVVKKFQHLIRERGLSRA